MLDIQDLLDCIIDDCVFDIYNGDTEDTEINLSRNEAEEWHINHSYELDSIEPIQRKDDNGYVVFGIVFNVSNVDNYDEN